ncbi:MAG: DUF4405 domain-containing protein [Fimbriimonadaceae bacterium]|nr:DUF4405 domain-containing protein [Fimbriimonadaceae bacterium]
MQGLSGTRRWTTPLVAVAFVAVGLTGLLMLCEVRGLPLRGVHEWMGVVLVLAGLWHLLVNWRQFLGHFTHRSAVLATVVAVLLTTVLLATDQGEQHHGPRGPRPGGEGERRAAVDPAR